MKSVYLYGPISGLSLGEAQDWRIKMASDLKPYDIEVVSPLRFKQYLAKIGKLSADGRDYANLNVLSRPPGVVARDKYDVTRVDMLAGNFLGADRVSIGSMYEQAWAHFAHKPIAAAVGPDGHPHDHMFFNETLSYKVDSLEALLDVILAVLT